MQLKVLLFIVSVILDCGATGILTTNNTSGCEYDEEEAESNPWTVALRVHEVNPPGDFYACTILDPFTVLTYGRPFHADTDLLAFLHMDNYTILINPHRNGSSTINFTQEIEVSYIQPHPYYARKINAKMWMYSGNDYIVIHLKTPIQLGPNVRPVCLPQLFNETRRTEDELNILFGENTTAIIGGWQKFQDLEKTSLTIKLGIRADCVENWKFKTRTEEIGYTNRVCGRVSHPNKNNPNDICIPKDSGAFVNHNGQYTFMGFVNNYYSSSTCGGCCKESVFFFVYRLNVETLTWLDNSLKCGSFTYTCHNGECVSLDTVCNQEFDGCSDKSDEDPKYCRALNPCTEEEFPCGTYGKCIPKFHNGKLAANCDRIQDCPLGEDEENCDFGIPSNQVIAGVGAGLGVILILLVFAAALIRRAMNRNTRWRLTEEDILEFELGLGCDNPGYVGDEARSEIERIWNKPYDSDEYEIPLNNIEKGERVGAGNFADVYRGSVKDHPKADVCAIKIPKSNADSEQIKCFLKELKIMAHVGRHENIINFIGAYTRGLKEGILYIIVEFCELGSLEDYLRTNRIYYHNQLRTASEQVAIGLPGYVSLEFHKFSTTDLLQWASQIAAGMTHLARKNVIHTDLAARNVLIDSTNRRAKICDFGLSHHLYTNITYVVAPDAKLPWKWIAVEVLLERALTTKSDVWSYGVTLWEIFSLGGVPYEGLKFSPAFAYSLSTSGCPLKKPDFANDEVFQIMKKCWSINPSERPNFENLQNAFDGLICQI